MLQNVSNQLLSMASKYHLKESDGPDANIVNLLN